MKKVTIFHSDNYKNLERQINNWISDKENLTINILDIKFSTTCLYHTLEHCALMIYQTYGEENSG